MTEKQYYQSPSDNPMDTAGFEFLEFATTQPETQTQQFIEFGFKPTAKHPQKAIWLFEQNDIRFILNAEPGTFAYAFAQQHGPAVSAMGFKVKNLQKSLAHAEKLKEPLVTSAQRTFDLPTLAGVGGSHIYLVDAT